MPTSGDGGKSPSGTGSINHQRAERPSDDKFRAGHARDGFGLRVHLACVVCLLKHLPGAHYSQARGSLLKDT